MTPVIINQRESFNNYLYSKKLKNPINCPFHYHLSMSPVDNFYKGLIESDLEKISRLHFYSKQPYTLENIKKSLHRYIGNLGYSNKIAENLVERIHLNKSKRIFRKHSNSFIFRLSRYKTLRGKILAHFGNNTIFKLN